MRERNYGYVASDFLARYTNDTIEDIIDKKVYLLYDFCLLTRRKRKPDPREATIRKLLADCGNESRMTITLRDVLIGRITLDDLIEKKGLN